MNMLNEKLHRFLNNNPTFKGKFVGYKEDRGGLGISRIDNDWFECEDYLISIDDLLTVLQEIDHRKIKIKL